MRLRTGDPRRPGYGRVRRGRGFGYVGLDGRPLGTEECERVRALVIPPAWRDVWICPWPNGHLQAVGTDSAGRLQYLYHPEFRRQREEAKHEHVLSVAAALPRLRRQVADDLQSRGLSRPRVTACAVRLLDLGFFRMGAESYARDNETFGLVTLLREHVECRAAGVRFHYPAKHSRDRTWSLTEPVVCDVVRALRRRRTQDDHLFAYWEGRAWHPLRGAELNDSLRELADTDITAKDFRTWHATVLTAIGLAVSTRTGQESTAARNRAVARTVTEVSAYLGNTPAVARSSYINPRVIELFEQGRTIADDLGRLGELGGYGTPATQGPVEEAVRRLLLE